jgi:hypothetical protein
MNCEMLSDITSQRLGNICYRNNGSRLCDNGETQLFDEVFPSRYTKNYLKRVTGRLQISEEERKEQPVSIRLPDRAERAELRRANRPRISSRIQETTDLQVLSCGGLYIVL